MADTFVLRTHCPAGHDLAIYGYTHPWARKFTRCRLCDAEQRTAIMRNAQRTRWERERAKRVAPRARS